MLLLNRYRADHDRPPRSPSSAALTKALAAMRGSSMKDLILQAVQREVDAESQSAPAAESSFPLIHLSSGRTLDLTGFDFDDLLA